MALAQNYEACTAAALISSTTVADVDSRAREVLWRKLLRSVALRAPERVDDLDFAQPRLQPVSQAVTKPCDTSFEFWKLVARYVPVGTLRRSLLAALQACSCLSIIALLHAWPRLASLTAGPDLLCRSAYRLRSLARPIDASKSSTLVFRNTRIRPSRLQWTERSRSADLQNFRIWVDSAQTHRETLAKHWQWIKQSDSTNCRYTCRYRLVQIAGIPGTYPENSKHPLQGMSHRKHCDCDLYTTRV